MTDLAFFPHHQRGFFLSRNTSFGFKTFHSESKIKRFCKGQFVKLFPNEQANIPDTGANPDRLQRHPATLPSQPFVNQWGRLIPILLMGC